MPGQLANSLGNTEVPLFVAKADAAVVQPPLRGNVAYVAHWNLGGGAVSQFDLELWAPAVNNLTVAELFGGAPQPLAIADDAVDTVDFANDELDLTSHGYQTGDGPLQLTTTGTLPTGLSATAEYYASVVSANTIQLHLTREAALKNEDAVAFSDVGSGTHTIVDVETAGNLTERVYWFSYGLLGQAADGAIGLTATKGYTQRLGHRPRTIAYAVSATLSASTLSASVYPIIEE